MPNRRSARIAFIQPYLQGYGGLEKFGVYAIRSLLRRGPVDVISAHVVCPATVRRAFGIDLEQANFVHDPRSDPPTAAGTGVAARLAWRRARTGYYDLTAAYDLVVGQTVSLPFRCGAARSLVLCHFPVVRKQIVDDAVTATGWRMWLSDLGREQRDVRQRLSSWKLIISNSEYTRKYVNRYWKRDSFLVYPPIDQPQDLDLSTKRPWIIGVGFFNRPGSEPGDPWSHKRQELLIETFIRLCDRGLGNWELHLAGHVLPPTQDAHEYVRQLQDRVSGYPIYLHPNCSHAELMTLYRCGSIFWHATGFGIDPEQHPERMEPFGMVTAEAMAWGCVPVVINQGGQPEIVRNGSNGFLWNTLEELEARTIFLISNYDERERLSEAAVESARQFGPDQFEERFLRAVDSELLQL